MNEWLVVANAQQLYSITERADADRSSDGYCTTDTKFDLFLNLVPAIRKSFIDFF